MALSNTATPKYYGMFRQAVMQGEIPVNEQVSQQMFRIDERIADPRYYYDDLAINGFILFCEAELTLTDGEPLKLLDTFKLWAEDLLAWFRYKEITVYEPDPHGHGGNYVRKMIKQRLTKKQYLIVARGAAKSMYASALQAYFLTVDTSATHQIATAPTMKQAEEVLSPISTAINRARGPYFQFLTEGSLQNTTGNRALRQKLVTTKKGIQNFLTSSILEVVPMSRDKLQGYRNKYNTVDEWLSGDVREDVISALEQGASKEEGWWIVAISSEGTVRNGSGDTIKMELQNILKGEYWAPQISIWWYKLDSVEEVAFPALWPKAQPNLGHTVTYETYQEDVERMESVPASRNDILAKRFGIPMEGYTYFFTYDETVPKNEKSFHGMPCAMGADLSRGDDFTAFTFLFPLSDGSFGVKTRSYVSDLAMKKIQASLRVKYEEFMTEGTLHVLPGNVLDMMDVYDDLEKFIIENAYDVRAFGYDPYNAKEFVTRWENEEGPFGIEKVIQGARTESVPLGELKHLAGEDALIFDEGLMQFAMGNAITMEDTNGNRKLLKRRQDQKIDNVSALLDAWVAYKLNKDAFD